jgi:transposase
MAGPSVGIDVCKDHLDVALRPGGSFRVGNDPAGHADLAARLLGLAPALVVLEATGGLEMPAAAALAAAGLAVALVNPRQTRDFARATGRLAKTDRLDAEALAHFAEAVRPEPRPLPAPEQRALDALVGRRRQLVEMRVMESNRLAACADEAVRAGIGRHLEWLARETDEADRGLGEAIRRSPAWREKDELLQSIPGVGPQVSRTLLAAIPELGTLSGGQVAALAGLAPYADDSGSRRGGRHVRGGRADVRRALYLAALSARRHCEPLREFAQRLAGRGKKAKVVLVAVARKLLVIANAILRTGKPWQPELAAAKE